MINSADDEVRETVTEICVIVVIWLTLF